MTATTSVPGSVPTASPAAATLTGPMLGRAGRWLLGCAAWTLLALLVALQNAVYIRSVGQPVHWLPLIGSRLADWYTCAVFTPAYFWLVRRYPLDRHHWPRHAPLYLGVTAVFVPLKYAMYLPLARAILPGPVTQSLTYQGLLTRNALLEGIAFWCLIGVVHAIVYYERFQEREAQAGALRARLARAQLEALSAQLHPHFLFNTLQGISTLIHRDPDAADRMLARLSDLLRRTLQRGPRHEVPLEEELAMLDDYIGIMQVRLGDRLTFEREIMPGCEPALVPHFIMQPLVENALQHGLAQRAGAGTVQIRASREGDRLQLSVLDDGPGFPPGDFTPRGIGLTNTVERLQQLYGEAQRVDLSPRAGGGTEVRLTLPFHLEPVTILS